MNTYRKTGSSRAGTWFTLFCVVALLWYGLPLAVRPVESAAATATPVPTATTAHTPPVEEEIVFDKDWIEFVELTPISDPPWSERPGLVNNSAWETIKDACSKEVGCDPKFMYWTWMSESGETDCTELLKQPGQNACRSRAGAQGPMQFMGAFYEAGISDPGWSIGNLHDSVRAACRMWTKMNLWSHTSDKISFALRFSAEDVYQAGRIPKLWTDRAWNVGQDGYNQALWIWDRVQSFNP